MAKKKKYGRKASEKVEQAMHERKRGTLRSGGSGRKVKSRKQAIAIGLAEARREGGKVPRKKASRKKSPARSKRANWSTFLRAHRQVLAASDFFTVEVWTPRGLLTHYVLFVISVAERAVHIAGITTWPNEAWMLQMGRNLIDEESGALASKHYLIVDRDTKYTHQFRKLVEEGGTEVIRLPPMSPNLNAYAERFVRSIKYECLRRRIFIGQASLRRAIGEYMAHYHEERNQQGLENRLIRPAPRHPANTGCLESRRRLGGVLHYYYRAAA